MLNFIYLILSDFFSSFSYYIAGKHSQGFNSTTELFAYSNIIIITGLIISRKFVKRKYKFDLFDFKKNLSFVFVVGIFLSVISSLLKTILLSNVIKMTQLELRSYAILCPFFTLLLCHFFLKNQKLNKYFLISFLISFGGLLTFSKLEFSFQFKSLLILYLCINSFSDFLLKKISKSRGIQMALFDNLMYFFVSSVVFTTAFFNEELTLKYLTIGKLSLHKFFNVYSFLILLLVAIVSFLAHNLKMVSYKIKHISGIIVFGIISKNFFSVLFTYIQYKKMPTVYQLIGISIMTVGCIMYSRRNIKSKS